jgi:hypothetical protein
MFVLGKQNLVHVSPSFDFRFARTVFPGSEFVLLQCAAALQITGPWLALKGGMVMLLQVGETFKLRRTSLAHNRQHMAAIDVFSKGRLTRVRY